jgi:hypothetical protein
MTMDGEAVGSSSTTGLSKWQRVGPILALAVLSPVIGEVMSGATLLSYIVVLLPEIMVWGCGTLMIREAVRRWRGGWTSMLLLGLALSIAEEFVIQQTSIAPLPWLGSNPGYGRVWGVNWPYFAFMLGFESVWIVLVPVQVTELLFPERRDQPWLRSRGLVISGVVFLIGSFVAWFSWTQMARPFAFHAPVYHPPVATVGLGLLAIVLLGIAAYAARAVGRVATPRTPPHPWAAVLAALVLGFPWYGLMALVFGTLSSPPLWLPMAAAAVWGTGAFLLIGRWTTATEWRDIHRWGLSFGALLVCMVAGFLGAPGWSRTDTVAKAVMNLVAVACMALLARRIARRSPA